MLNLTDERFEISDADIDEALQRMFTLDQPRTNRGVGYCDNIECKEYCQGVFLWLHEGDHVCRTCAQVGFIVPERGRAERESGKFFGEVRVQFDYVPAIREYLQTAIIRDDTLGADCGVYYLQNPMCKTDKRAFAIGESLLSSLNDKLYANEDLVVPPPSHERVYDLGKPIEELRVWLGKFEERIKANPFFKRVPKEGAGVVSQFSGDLNNEGEDRGPQSDSHHRTADEGP